MTVVRTGDGHAATRPDPTWLPIADTPMHPEYPCAHCINAAAVGVGLEAEFGSQVPAFTMTSPTAPGVTHRWTNISDHVDEVSDARVWTGFHYRNSTEVGKNMGHRIPAFGETRFPPRKVPAHQ